MLVKGMKKSESSLCTADKNVYGAAILENNPAVPQIVKYKVTTYIFLGIHQEKLNICPNLYTKLHGSITRGKEKNNENKSNVKWYELIKEMQFIHKAILLE